MKPSDHAIEDWARNVMPDMFRANDNYIAAYMCGYYQGTREQRRIDIDKIGEWLTENYDVYGADKSIIDGLTKAMEIICLI